MSFTFRERRPSNIAINYKGGFKTALELNAIDTDDLVEGDYYVCGNYNVLVGGILYTYNDNAVWNGSLWVRDKNMRVILTTTTIDLPVDPALLANVPDVPEQDIADIIAEWGAAFINVQEHINDEDIHVSPLDRQKWDGMLPKDGSEPMEGDLNLDGYNIGVVNSIRFEQGGFIANLDGNDLTIQLPNGQVFRFDEFGLDMDYLDLKNVKEIIVSTIRATNNNGVNIIGSLNFDGTPFGAIRNLRKGTFVTDGANLENIIEFLTGHNDSETAHLYIRELIQALQQDIDRLDGKGKSYGEVNYLQSQLEIMTDSARNTAIVADINSRIADYQQESGDLVYTKNDGVENTHEWEFNGTVWVDNGAYTVDKASNTEFGIVKGNDYVSIVSGLLQILKSDYATRIGDPTESLTYLQLNTILNTLISDVADRYTKSETYNKTEVDVLLNQLKAVFGWEDTLILNESTATTYSASIFQGYDYVWLFSGGGSQLVKTNLLYAGEVINLGASSFIEVGANWLFTGTKLSAYGIKMDGSLVNEVRDVGETNIVRKINGDVYQVVGEQVTETIERDASGRVIKVTEAFALDGNVYETTFVRDSNGSVISYKKEKVV